MASDPIDPVFPESAEETIQPELMVSAVLHLMSHYYTMSNRESCVCIRLASVIERYLKTLASLPELAPVLRATCQPLSWQWEIMVQRMLPPPERNKSLTRWLTAGKPG